MSIRASIMMELKSDTIIGSGYSIPGGEDIAVKVDRQGYPYLAGETFKGLFRAAMEDLLEWMGEETMVKVSDYFGERQSKEGIQSWEGNLAPRPIYVTPLLLSEEDHKKEADQCFSIRTFTKMENGMAATGSLRMASCIRSGLTFVGSITCEGGTDADQELIQNALRCIKYIGTSRTRGFGRVSVSVLGWETIAQNVHQAFPGSGNLLRYRITLKEPVRITNRTESHDTFLTGQSYIPGSTVRGAVLDHLAKDDPVWFETNKHMLMKELRFANVLPDNGIRVPAVIPTPKGFYSDKLGDTFYHLLTENEEKPDTKRAALGTFAVLRPEAKEIETWSPKTGENTRINLKLQHDTSSKSGGMFQTSWLEAGQTASGLVILPEKVDHTLKEKLEHILNGEIRFGASVHSGCGLCEISDQIWTRTLPEAEAYSFRPSDPIPSVLYLALLSPMALLNAYGEPCGITRELLQDMLGVEVLDLMCATSVIERHGFNRTMGTRLPIQMMYDSGSIFRITCNTPPTLEAIHALEESGMGIRREEGFGRVVFLKELKNIHKKANAKPRAFRVMSEAQKMRQTRIRWIHDHPMSAALSNSQMGTLQTLCFSLMDAPENAQEKLDEWFEDLIERNDHNRAMFRPTQEFVRSVLTDSDIPADAVKERLQLLIDLIKFDRRGND